MKYFIAAFIFISMLAPAYANAAVTKQFADKMCKAFIEHREKFKEITKTTDCTAYISMSHPVPSKCFEYKTKGEKEPVKYALGNFETGTCDAGDELATFINAEQVQPNNEVNSSINGYDFGTRDVVLEYDKTLFLTNQDDSDLRLVTKDGDIILCGIVNQLKGWKSTSRNSRPICEQFAKGDYALPEIKTDPKTIPLKVTDALYRGEIAWQTHVDGTTDVDINYDAKTDQILTVTYSSGGGCGCGIRSLSLGKTDNSNEASDNELDGKIKQLTAGDCSDDVSDEWSAITLNGASYIAANVRYSKMPIASMTSRRTFRDRVLYQYTHGNFKEVCRAKPESKRVIDKDVIKEKYMLEYKPIE